jgi:beta-N-acetylhexosaminidase
MNVPIRPRPTILPALAVILTAFLSACGAGPSGAPAAGAIPRVTAEEARDWAQKTLGTLSLEQKAGQMICAEIRGEYIATDDPRYQGWLSLVRNHGVGAVVLYGGTPHDTAALLNRLQKAAALPLLVSADFEGGPGQQIAGATEFPANMAVSAAGSEDLAYAVGKAGAAEGRAVGIHLTYSPDVDIQTDPDNPVLGVRSFGADLDLLARMAGAYIRGYQENEMLAAAKHFPGRGEVRLIEGTEYTVNPKSVERVEAEDFRAFKAAIDAGVAYIMSEHIAVPSAAGGSDLPASVEKKLATDWLKDRLGFKGILTTDDMWYEKVVKRFGAVEACLKAVEAGHDAILKPADPVAVIGGLVDAVKSGRIPESRIDASVLKILEAKARLGLHLQRFVDEGRVADVVGRAEHKALLQRVADQSLTLLKNDGFFPTTADKLGSIVHISLQRREIDPAPALVDAKLKAAFPKVQTFFLGPTTARERFEEARQAAAAADTVLVSLFQARTAYKDNGPLHPADKDFLDLIFASQPKRAVAMAYGNPYVAEGVKKAAAVAVGYGEGGFYGNQTVYADSLIRLLKGEIKPAGMLPVNVSAAFPLGTGVRY